MGKDWLYGLALINIYRSIEISVNLMLLNALPQSKTEMLIYYYKFLTIILAITLNYIILQIYEFWHNVY